MGKTIKLANETYLVNDLYKTNEIRIGTWIDGKPIYRKVFVGTTSSTYDYFLFASNINMIINTYGYIKYDGTNWTSILNCVGNLSVTYNFTLDIAGANNSVWANYSSSLKGKDYIIIMEYTKTTD